MGRARVKISAQFVDLISQAGFTQTRLAQESGTSTATIRAIIDPWQHPRRRGGLYRTTAWKLARTYAKETGINEEDAFNLLFEDFDPKSNPDYAFA